MNFGPQLRIGLWLVCVLLVGCKSTHQARNIDLPAIEISPYEKVGSIAQVDLNSATVVVKLDSNLKILPNELYVRNERLQITALLKPTALRTNLSVGMILLRGAPKAGQEVFKKNDVQD